MFSLIFSILKQALTAIHHFSVHSILISTVKWNHSLAAAVIFLLGYSSPTASLFKSILLAVISPISAPKDSFSPGRALIPILKAPKLLPNGIHAAFTWHPRCFQTTPMPLSRGTHAASKQCPRHFHVAPTLLPNNAHATFTRRPHRSQTAPQFFLRRRHQKTAIDRPYSKIHSKIS